MKPIIQVLKSRDRSGARGAPSGPGFNDHDFARFLAKVPWLEVDRGRGQVWRQFAKKFCRSQKILTELPGAEGFHCHHAGPERKSDCYCVANDVTKASLHLGVCSDWSAVLKTVNKGEFRGLPIPYAKLATESGRG